ncbi:EamA family transporter, partial [Mycobacterium tuberculosis]|nr:EamA family transporter [Mycobacterium tuberculosis]
VVAASGMWRALPLLANRRIVIRLFGEVVSSILYMAGFILLSVADATALFQVTPLATTAAAAVFLKEQVGWRRWAAVAAGFVGVLVILRPG